MIINYLINEFLKSSALSTHLSNLTDSAKGFFLTSLITSLNKPILYLANDPGSAINLYYEIKNLTTENICYFCSQEVSAYDQISSDVDVISHQAKTLISLTPGHKKCLIISSLKCLSEKIWNKEDFTKYSFKITKSSSINSQELSEKLVLIGYKKTPLVTNRGEFSTRGNIFDIYPIIGEPSRIELFGDEIESIKTYLISTQRSIEDINEIIINPRYYIANLNTNELANKIKDLIKGSKEFPSEEIEQIRINSYCESVEYYSQLINQRDSSLFDYLPKETLVIVDDWNSNITLLENWHKRNLEIKNELENNKKIIPLPHLLIHDEKFVIKSLQNFTTSYIERFETFDIKTNQLINLAFYPSDKFQNQIDKFAAKVKEWISLNNKVVIFSDQVQRIKGILREWDLPSFTSESENIKEEDYKSNQIIICKGGTTNGFIMSSSNIVILTDEEIFGTKRKPNFLKKQTKLDKHEYFTNIEDLKVNDYVVHIKHGIGKYRGLVKMTVDDISREYLMIEYASDGKLYIPAHQVNLLYRYRGSADVIPKLSKLGGAEWELTKKRVKKAVKRIAEDLLNLYTARSKLEGFSFNQDSHWQIEMEEAFPYTETPDQWKAICEVKTDMESTKPMDRLICGDVGYGKTEVALRAIFKAILSGKQAAVLVPTTILAQQHFNTIFERLAPYTVRIGILSRFISQREQKDTIAKLALGEIDLVIGTHRLLQKDVVFKDLGLVVIDEEQRFGVIHKEKLKQLRVTVDVVTLSATPIPRTLNMALSGAKDMSLINTPPLNRLPIKTFVGEFKPTIIKTSILHELERGGQVYFVHNKIETIYKTAAFIKELTPEANIAIAHGQMQEKELEKVMLDFWAKKYNVLVCTTIIESGLDIPNVNTIIIDNADQMGLAQLYQLRGRVGRAEIQAFAYCLYLQNKILSEVAKNRLQAIKEFSNLGSGYQIALRDMEIRGVGNILGQEQHGHMISVGFDLYCKLLNEAVDKLRGLEVEDIELETVVDLNISAFIPNTYIEDEGQKVIEYKRLANVRTNKELEYLSAEWKDRFGNFPKEAENLIKIVELRILASQVGIKTIKSESGLSPTIKIDINFRLQNWLSIQSLLPKDITDRTIFKSNAREGSHTSYLLFKTLGLIAERQLELLFELLGRLRSLQINKKIA
ncbi:MAG: transcription-repair coupling factor [Candidatus Melainabacteria bacterium]|nr:transcription-repair coupling factor [Candidatus Melainabacteria bacterium]